jgi:phosphate-selective porin OprO/OprP
LKLLLSALAASILLTAGGYAQTIQSPAADRQGIFDAAWKFAQWYENDRNPTVQNVLFSGRFQYDYATVDANQGNHSEWNVRRLRLGMKSRLFREFTVHAEADLNPQERAPFYIRLTDAYVQWSRTPKLELTFGKQGVPFTLDGSTSSKELLTIDRNNLSNNIWFPQEYMPGVSAAGELSGWIYHMGVYSAGETNREFGQFSGSVFTLVSLGRDLASSLGADKALLTGSYVYQNPDAENNFTRQLHHVGSVNLTLEKDRWGMRSDLSAASGYLGQNGLWGFVVMPYFDLTSALQLVARETFLNANDVNAVRLATYENQVVTGRGDRFNELYIGANYYFYGHKLKLQSGLQFSDMNDAAADGGEYSGYSWSSGLRVSW